MADGGGGQGGTGRVLNTCKSYSEPQFHLVLQWSNHDVHSVWRNRNTVFYSGLYHNVDTVVECESNV